MDETPKVDPLAKAVRSLSVAVWILALSILGLFAFYAFMLFKSMAFSRGATSISSTSSRTTHAAVAPGMPADGKSFNSLPVEEKIKRSSAILLTKHERNGGRLKAVVSEILKRPDAGLNYSVGDELGDLARDVEADTDYGDGDVVFLVGGAGDMRESMTYRRGRISGLGDMPLDVFRAIVRGGAAPRPESPSAGQSGSASSGSSTGGSGPMIDLERTTNGEGVTRAFSISTTAALAIPQWFPEKGEPPLGMSKAIRIATDAAGAQSANRAEFVARSIRLQLVSCDEPVGNRWYYVLDCVPRQSGGLGMTASVPVVVLMDGTVVAGAIQR